MITRFYADNFRTLVNFDLKFDQMNLLMGSNGSGKSSVFEVLRRLQRFISGDCRLNTAFPSQDLTRWQSVREQRFELDVKVPEGELTYTLVIEHLNGAAKCRVKEETLREGQHFLFKRALAEIRLYHDDYSPGPVYPFDGTLSALATVQANPDNQKLTAFRRLIGKLIIASISPPEMEKDSVQDADRLSERMENFVSWYRRVSHENMESTFELFEELKEVIPGFASLNYKDAGQNTKSLKILFDQPGEGKKQITFDFSELSDGQRALIALYALIHAGRDGNLCLFLDEPDNFVALREIQPWLMALNDARGENISQTVLISHHPEIINFLGNIQSQWLSRGTEGPTRIKEIPVDDDGLTLAEIVARGWTE